ncbi:MAG: membrane dipeptidase [Bacteroidetes bacterium]|nr:membrane dipeptidase [Bacteroidota bacterium]
MSEDNICFQVVDSASELENGPSSDKILCLFAIEYFHGLFDKDTNLISQCKKSGIAYITIIDSPKDSLFFQKDNKYFLTEQGQNVVKKMNALELKGS